MINSNYEKLIDRIYPEDIINYARSTGWQEINIGVSDRPIKVFRNESGKDIWIPSKRDIIDYKEGVDEVVDKISKYEEKSKGDVLQEMSLPASDILRLGVSNKETKRGTIPLKDGINLYEKSKRLLESSANSVEEPDKRYHKEYSHFSEKYAESCKIGRSEVGSYVAKIISPIDFNVQGDLFDEEVSFSRKATERLFRSIRFLSEKIEEGDYDSILNPEENEIKVSGDFCKSLSNMAPRVRGTGLMFKLDSTKTAPPPSDDTPTSASLEERHIPFIERIAEELEPSEELVDGTFSAQVDSLRGRPNEDGEMRGLVRLEMLVSRFSGSVTASIKLPPDLYQTACDAHKEGGEVEVEGTLRLKEEKNRIHRFEEFRRFEIRE
jgi:hypothetical protein